MVSGQIYEGQFYDGLPHGYGRVIEYHHNYIGMWDQGRKVDESRIEWSSGMDDGGALSTKFDQNLLAAKKKMKG